ncbi:type VI secretion system-associated protein TagF [Azospirillum picis]|uniref:Type VI secretion system protein ImpM n=1 Tax=Azospirillum picis TaxID=488438 RepID=A0ABU0MSA2_9PROT|nr:type VI secretion system-associated protein TagF [Azospirillum picis]MBP2301918.1 type VI secretion system protein ImpM [Azospirillum picis]MDQ0536367.1 type VI secretion system protein ImpM [Azospirillum picis]
MTGGPAAGRGGPGKGGPGKGGLGAFLRPQDPNGPAAPAGMPAEMAAGRAPSGGTDSNRVVGFHGKVPARGDFIAHGLPPAVLGPWDRWLSAALGEAGRRLGGEWESLFGQAPAWRFALSAGLCGPAPLVGVWMPSADRVGRLYPFTIAASLPTAADLAGVPAACAGWLGRAEALALDACRAGTDVEGLPARLAILGRPEPDRVPAATRALLGRLSGPLPAGASLWWTRGGGRVSPSLLSCAGLPAGPRLAAFLDGAWERWGWENAGGE